MNADQLAKELQEARIMWARSLNLDLQIPAWEALSHNERLSFSRAVWDVVLRREVEPLVEAIEDLRDKAHRQEREIEDLRQELESESDMRVEAEGNLRSCLARLKDVNETLDVMHQKTRSTLECIKIPE